eukprot:COSAG05_NODE_984_length_6299_cov_4.250323_1_plen_62_part_10
MPNRSRASIDEVQKTSADQNRAPGGLYEDKRTFTQSVAAAAGAAAAATTTMTAAAAAAAAAA